MKLGGKFFSFSCVLMLIFVIFKKNDAEFFFIKKYIKMFKETALTENEAEDGK